MILKGFARKLKNWPENTIQNNAINWKIFDGARGGFAACWAGLDGAALLA